MAKACKCDGGLGNTGRPGGCAKPLTVPKGIYQVQTYDSTGAKNFIDASVAVDDAFIMAKINQSDVSKRWYPLQEIENFQSARAESAKETSPGGRTAITKQGERPFSFEVWDGGSVLAAQVNKGKCQKVSFFILTEGRITGMDLDGDLSKLYPIRIAKNSLEAIYVFPTDTTTEKFTVGFQYDTREIDDNMAFIETSADVLGYSGLTDIHVKYSAITTTGFTATLFHNFEAMNDKGILTGLVLGDFALFNTTSSLAVIPTSVTYNTTTKAYTIVMPAQTTGSKIRVTVTKAGYDTSDVVASLVTIP